MRFLLFILFSFIIAQVANAQVCKRNNTPQAIAAGNFELNYNASGGAEIQDKISGIIWKRCVYGQQWNGSSCDGTPIKLTWQEALQVATAEGWRIPTIKELSLILDHQCIAPPLHPELFPGAPASENNGLWSSTPYITASSETTNAWWMDLMFGGMNFRAVSTTNFALFVK